MLTRETKGRVGGGDGEESSSASVSSDLPVNAERRGESNGTRWVNSVTLELSC